MVNGELIIDNFAGGGGASTGIEIATGQSVDIAINHDPKAILMHKTNHPSTKHYCESVWDVDPIEATEGKPVALAWFSPDCKHFSKAKGSKPKDKNIRGLAWVTLRWAAKVRPRVIILENVEEFQKWGPLNRKHRPIKSKIGQTFRKFISQLEGLGYSVEYRELIAADYGAPTKRKRFFMVARCDGRKITWAKQTHAERGDLRVESGELKEYVPAYACIDFTKPCPSIFETKEEIKEKYGITAQRPLAEKTMQRIARGIEKFVINNPEPFIVQTDGENTLVPYIMQYHGQREKKGSGEARGQNLGDPLLTVDASNRYGLVTSFISKFYKTGIGQDMREPLHTVTTSTGHFGEVRAFLIKYYGKGTGQDIAQPLDTVTANDRFGLVEIKGERCRITDIGMRMLEPSELYKAQGFPDDYIIDHDYKGNTYTRAEQVKRCGNAVPPPFAAALVKANLPELCIGERRNNLNPYRLKTDKNGQMKFA